MENDTLSDLSLSKKIEKIMPILNESQKRLYLASEAEAFGRGGISEISRISGVSRVTITAGIKELKSGTSVEISEGRIRKSGAGRKKIEESQPEIIKALENIIENSLIYNINYKFQYLLCFFVYYLLIKIIIK